MCVWAAVSCMFAMEVLQLSPRFITLGFSILQPLAQPKAQRHLQGWCCGTLSWAWEGCGSTSDHFQGGLSSRASGPGSGLVRGSDEFRKVRRKERLLVTPALPSTLSLRKPQTALPLLARAYLFLPSLPVTRFLPARWHLAWVANNREGGICQAAKPKAVPALPFCPDPGKVSWADLVNILVSRTSLCVSWKLLLSPG